MDGYTFVKQHCPNAVEAEEWERQGNEFDPQMQMIVSAGDRDSSLAMDMTIRVFGKDAVAFHGQLIGPSAFSLEVEFSGAAKADALRFYNNLPKRITSATVAKLARQYSALEPLTHFTIA